MNREQRRSFLVFVLIVLAVFVMAAKVKAADQGSCANPGQQGNGASLRVWENVNGDTSDGNDTWYAFCHVGSGAAYSYLELIQHTPPGYCNKGVGHLDDWNDCIDQATVWLPSSLWRACFFQDTARRTLSYYIQGYSWGDRWALPHDSISGFLITNNGTCVP